MHVVSHKYLIRKSVHIYSKKISISQCTIKVINLHLEIFTITNFRLMLSSYLLWQWGFFFVPYLLRHRTSVYTVPSEGLDLRPTVGFKLGFKLGTQGSSVLFCAYN
jgi:hypothetical protein